jgi:hypothetical protein
VSSVFHFYSTPPGLDSSAGILPWTLPWLLELKAFSFPCHALPTLPQVGRDLRFASIFCALRSMLCADLPVISVRFFRAISLCALKNPAKM